MVGKADTGYIEAGKVDAIQLANLYADELYGLALDGERAGCGVTGHARDELDRIVRAICKARSFDFHDVSRRARIRYRSLVERNEPEACDFMAGYVIRDLAQKARAPR